MANFLTRLVERAEGAPPAVLPRRPSKFEPPAGGDSADPLAADVPVEALPSPTTRTPLDPLPVPPAATPEPTGGAPRVAPPSPGTGDRPAKRVTGPGEPVLAPGTPGPGAGPVPITDALRVVGAPDLGPSPSPGTGVLVAPDGLATAGAAGEAPPPVRIPVVSPPSDPPRQNGRDHPSLRAPHQAGTSSPVETSSARGYALRVEAVRPSLLRLKIPSERERHPAGEVAGRRAVGGETPPVIHVSIGRIEVSAVHEPRRAAPRNGPGPLLTLEEYLRQRMRGER